MAFDRLGTGTVLVFGFAAVVTGCLAMCWAELGSRYPNSGGVYGLVARTLGRWPGFVCLVLHLVAGAVVSSALALACGGALASLRSGWPSTVLLPKMSSAQVKRHVRTRGGCRRCGDVCGCVGEWCRRRP